ncbi:hypothetical protein CISG_09475 [Coccidioides immitis RMSCC 3703]|uniref:Uncharacterized protein n=1 Tax=Coccidioides immitis RMSCC 3703 TaxID=454286 RepID=A0A0J8RA66_COCIT|nr:hypothetical protein CISG_09475 [Coccidioides immitis RMSCC 3703]
MKQDPDYQDRDISSIGILLASRLTASNLLATFGTPTIQICGFYQYQMARARYDNNGRPIFELPYIPLPEKIPEGLTPDLVTRFRYGLRRYLLLEHLWTVQLGTIYVRNHRNIVHAHAFWSEHGPRTWEGKQYGLTETWITNAMLKAKYELIGLVRTSRLRTLINARLNERSETTPPQISGKAQEPISPRNCGGKSDSTSKEEDVESYSSGQNLMELRASRRGYWSRPSFPGKTKEEPSIREPGGDNQMVTSQGVITCDIGTCVIDFDGPLAGSEPFTRAEGHNNVVPIRLGEQLQKMKDADPGWERRERRRNTQLQAEQIPCRRASDTRDIS